MPNYQLCDFSEFMSALDGPDDDLMSPEEYLKLSEPLSEEPVNVPREFVNTRPEKTALAKEGETLRMVRNTPGILPPCDGFGKNYKPAKLHQQPDMILDDKIPVILNSKYFQFKKSPKVDHTEFNDFDGASGRQNRLSELEQCFTDNDSDDDNIKVIVAATTAKPSPKKYFNPFELYQKKRNINWTQDLLNIN